MYNAFMDERAVIKELNKYASKKKAESSAWFFKTGEGHYGYGDVFIGVTVPEQRVVAKKFADLPLKEISKLLKSKIHEHRLTALIILVNQYKKAENNKNRKEIFDFYLAHSKYINNWDLVDTSAKQIVGAYLKDKNRKILYKLVKSKNLWERRISIIATHYFLATHDFADILKISTLLLSDTHDLIHKAVGWTLREVGKRNRATLVSYLDKHKATLPRTALRYAIEHMSEIERKKYLQKK